MLKFNNNVVENVNFNKNEVKKVIYNNIIVFEKKAESYIVRFSPSGTADLTKLLVSGLEGKEEYQSIIVNQKYTCYKNKDVILKAIDNYKIAIYTTDDAGGVIGYGGANTTHNLNDFFANNNKEIIANHSYRIAVAVS